MKKTNSLPDPFYSGIHFFNESAGALPVTLQTCKNIAKFISNGEACQFEMLEVVFVNEKRIVAINRQHLDHNYVTDVISFRYDRDFTNQAVEGTLYCCAQQIAEQADDYGQPVEKEFQRIIIHGMLHLVGYEDKSASSREKMREREAYYLGQLQK